MTMMQELRTREAPRSAHEMKRFFYTNILPEQVPKGTDFGFETAGLGMNTGGDAESRKERMDAPGTFVASRLTERVIRKELRSAALQHPATILPLAIGALSLFHLVGISPFLGQALWARCGNSGCWLILLDLLHSARCGIREKGPGNHVGTGPGKP